MALTVEQAAAAGVIAAKIQTVQWLLDQATAAQNGGWLISRLEAQDPAGVMHPLITATLDPVTSADALTYCIGVYQGILADLNAQLAAIP